MPEDESSIDSEKPGSTSTALPPRNAADQIVLAIATGLGTGLSPKAPGTVGSVLGVLIVWGCTVSLPGSAIAAFAVVSVAVAPSICARACKLLGKHDPGAVVYDEIIAFWFVFLPQIAAGVELTLPMLVAGFVLFRIFDIWKPWPCNRLEKLPGGAGIMADDVAAGLMAGACLWAGLALFELASV